MAPKAKEKPKPSSAVAAITVAAPLEELFSSLHRHVQGFEYEKAAGVADQILAAAPGDEDALRCKVVALIKSDAIEAALSAIEASQGIVDFGFSKAYCLYRLNKLHDALENLSGQERSSMVLQLESQILYRLGRMDSCMECYDKLQAFKIDSLDLKTNIIATLVAAGRASEVQDRLNALKVKPSTSSFDMAYNIACSLIERGKYVEAEEQLLSARRIGHEMLIDEEYPDDEIETELAPIAVQLAFAKQLLGHTQEATEAYSEILNRNLADPSSLAVATNNLISLRGSKDVSDSMRKLDRIIEKAGGSQKFQLAKGLDFKLFQRQKEALYTNRLLLLLQSNKLDQAHELVASVSELFPGSPTPVLLQAAVHLREKKVLKSEEVLGSFADKYPEKSRSVLLARAQIAAAAGHSQVAADSLSRVADIQHLPATLATLVSLKERSGDVSGASSVLDAAVEWWKNSMTGEDKLNVIMREAASFKLQHGKEEEASRLYKQLVKGSGNVEALVGLVATAAKTDLEKAELYAKKLRPLSGLKGIDVGALEKTSGAKHVEGAATVARMEVSEEAKKSRTKKRKRKPRYPKGFDPNNLGPPPDPERWLPKRERSTYRPKRKDKRAQIRGSQGAVVREKQDTGSALNAASSSKAAAAAQASTSSDRSKASSSKSRKKSRA